jgi:hypothetical protein
MPRRYPFRLPPPPSFHKVLARTHGTHAPCGVCLTHRDCACHRLQAKLAKEREEAAKVAKRDTSGGRASTGAVQQQQFRRPSGEVSALWWLNMGL